MDPITAAFNALDSFNKFLVTPAGQVIATQFASVVGGIFNVLHLHLQSSLAKVPTNETK